MALSDEQRANGVAGLTLFALIIPSILFRGFILSYMWLWFMVPLGVVSIGIAHAIGLSTLLHFVFLNMAQKEKSKKTSPMNHVLSTMIFGPLFVFWVAWIVHLFM